MLGQMLPNLATCCQSLSKRAKSRQISPGRGKACQIFPNPVESFQILPNLAKSGQVVSNPATSCRILPNLGESRQMLSGLAGYTANSETPEFLNFCDERTLIRCKIYSKSRQIWPRRDLLESCRNIPRLSEYPHLAPRLAKYWRSLSNLLQIPPKLAKSRQVASNPAISWRRSPNLGKSCEMLPGLSEPPGNSEIPELRNFGISYFRKIGISAMKSAERLAKLMPNFAKTGHIFSNHVDTSRIFPNLATSRHVFAKSCQSVHIKQFFFPIS